MIYIKIAWLNDVSLSEFQGGCNITNSLMIEKGRELGHEIKEITPSTMPSIIEGFESLWLKESDLVILNNVNAFNLETIGWIIKNKKYVRYEHDYAFCEKRTATCKPKCQPAKIFIDLFSNSLLNIFLSPLHLEKHRDAFGELMRDAIYIPSPIKKDTFYPDANKKEVYLYVGVLMSHKGVHQILDYADTQEDKIFHFAGKAINKQILDRINEKHTYLGEIPYREMPQLYGKYKYLVLNPCWPEPFGRVFIEGIASGCQLIKFDQTWKSGFESYNLPKEEMIEKCINAPIEFWKKIKEVI